MAVSAVLIAGASFRYLAGGEMMIPPSLKSNFMGHPLAFYVHIAAGTTALAVGPWQFLAGWRRRAPGLHRMMGMTYVAACTVGGLAGMAIAPTSNGGPLAASGFFTLAVLWLVTTGTAFISILRHDVAAHHRWMRRSFALTLAGVTLRVYLPLALVDASQFLQVYAVIAWACWVPNLIIVEWMNRRLART
jgi:uncharacterized membrane protein